MRRYALIMMLGRMMLAAAWAAIPSTPTVIGAASLATASLLAARAARAGTALLPGWTHACGRNPRCFERGEHRRLMARLRAAQGGRVQQAARPNGGAE